LSNLFVVRRSYLTSKLWDAFMGEEMRLQQVSTNYKDNDDVLDLALIGKVRRGGRKGGPRRGQNSKDEESDS